MSDFVRRVIIVLAIAAGFVFGAWLLAHSGPMVLILFSALLAGVFFDAVAGWLSDRTPVHRKVWLVATVVLLVAASAAAVWWTKVSIEVNQEHLSQMGELVAQVRSNIREIPVLGDISTQRLLETAAGSLAGGLQGLGVVLSGLSSAVIVAVAGFFVAWNPQLYSRPALALIPPRARRKAADVTREAVSQLRSWLVGRIFTMVAVGVLTGVGLFAIGLPLAGHLGLVAGLFSFVPYIGPFASVIPAILVVGATGWQWTLLAGVLGVYAGAQFLEGNFVTPLVQQHQVSVPPAALLLFQVLMGIIGGIPGVIVSTPILVVVIVLVKRLHVERVRTELVLADTAGPGTAASPSPD